MNTIFLIRTEITIGKIAKANVKIRVHNKNETAFVSEMKIRLTSDTDSNHQIEMIDFEIGSCVVNKIYKPDELSCKAFTLHVNNEVKVLLSSTFILLLKITLIFIVGGI